MQRKLIETHAAMKYYRRNQKSQDNPLNSVKASYKHLQNVSDEMVEFLEAFCNEEGFKSMVPFRQRCEEYSTVKFPRLTNLKKYKPPPKVDPFKDI
jgi:hypothetical protein